MENDIFCFGGSTSYPKASDTVMTKLGISANFGSTAEELKKKWAIVNTEINNLNIQARDTPQSMQLPDGKTLLIQGGFSRPNVTSNCYTLAFNGETLSWNKYANYQESPYGNRQM